MKMMVAGLALCATACTTMAADTAPASRAESCDAAPAQGLVGRAASTEAAAEAQRLSGAEVVRWLQPGQIVTMEYREGRLNITLDETNRIKTINCG